MAHPSKPFYNRVHTSFACARSACRCPGVPAYRFPNRRRPIHSRPARPTCGRTPTTFNRVVEAQAAHPPPRPTGPPGPVGPGRITRLVDRRRGSFLPRSPAIVSTSHLVAPFVVARRHGATHDARTTRHCLAADFARLEAGFYLEHTPPLRRLNHLTDQLERASGTGYHSGSRRGSQVSDGRHADGHVASRCDPAGCCRMSALPQRHSFPSR